MVRIVDDEKIVTQALSNLFNAYAKAFNKQQSRTGSLFEKHFKRIKPKLVEKKCWSYLKILKILFIVIRKEVKYWQKSLHLNEPNLQGL